jgi:mannose-1-phosphate guanylyltransferase
LLGDALVRALAIANQERVLAVVTERHRPYWTDELDCLRPDNVIVQPSNRGTAAGVLLPLLSILERSPQACVAILPSDHHVREEAVLRIALLLALQYAERAPGTVCMLGLEPDSADCGYGWILPQRAESTLHRVGNFVEKPEALLADFLMRQGALWNSFILAGTVQAFVSLYRQRLPALLEALSAVQGKPACERPKALQRAYEEFAPADFSRDLLQGSEAQLRVLEVPPCGWTDLGTPQRLAECLRTGHGRSFELPTSEDTPILFERLHLVGEPAPRLRRQRARDA